MSHSMWSSQSSRDYPAQSSSSVAPGKRSVPYAMNTNQPPTPSSMFDSSAHAIVPFASPSGYSQPPTPSSLLDPHMSHHSSISSQTQQTHGSAAANPMTRYIDNQEGPYSALHLTAASIPDDLDRTAYPQSSFMAMQPSVKSDSASIVTPLHQHHTAADSGYFTHPSKTYSTGSAEPVAFDQSLPPDVMNLDPIHFQRKPSNRSRPHRNVPSSVPSSVPHHQAQSSSGDREELLCPYCPHKPRLKSELKKHILRHVRPFKCEDKSCPRSRDGFTTPNDLDRHKRSKHNIFPDTAKVYICASAACREANKSWPRYDNFKQHVERMHKMEDMEALIEASECSAKDVQQQNLAEVDDDDLRGGTQGVPASRDIAIVQNEHYTHSSAYDDPQMINHGGMTTHHPVHSQADDYSDPDSLNNDFDHQRYNYPASVGRPGYPEFSTNQFEDHQLAVPQDAHLAFEYENAFDDLAGPEGPSIVVHNAQEQKQRQDQDLAHVFDNAAPAAGDPLDDGMFGRVFKDANIADDWKSNPTLSINGSQLASRVRQPLSTRPGKSASKVYKANSVAGSRAQVTVVNNGRVGQDRGQRGVAASSGAQCWQCKKILPRQCDLKKHERRHTRPFGCTFDMCNKQFGSKNDWKRHESSQHFQEEQWRCDILLKDGEDDTQCADLFDDWDSFLAHLQQTHGADEAQMEMLQREARIGRNHQKSFWCGFCRRIVRLEKIGRKAWDERFDHIGDHFLQDPKNIKDWLSPQGHRTKGQMRAENQTGTWSSVSPTYKEENCTKVEDISMVGIEGEIDGDAEVDGEAEAEADVAEPEARISARDTGLMPASPTYCCACHDGPYSQEFRHCACVKCQHSCEQCFDRTTRTRRAQ